MTAAQEHQGTDVVEIPADWSIASLGGLGRCIRGVSYKPEHLMPEACEGVTTLLRSNNIRNDRVNFDEVQFVAGCKISVDQYARPFDIAICMSNGSKALVGKSGVITPDHIARHPKLAVGAFCAIYRSTVPYTAQIFKSQFFQSAIDVQLAGSAINNLKGSDIEGIQFPLPPVEEQQKIAAILTAVDDKLDVIARQIEATQILKQGLMQTLFSRGVGTQDADGRWMPHTEFKDSELGKIPASWSTGELLSFLELQRGVDLPVQDRRAGEVPIFGSNGMLGFHDSSICNGSGVMTGRSGTIGKVFYSEGPYWPLNTSLYVKDFKGNLPKFIYYKLGAIGLERFATGTGVPTLNRNVAHKEMVAFPPLPEQQKIAAILRAVDDKLEVITRQIEITQTLKRGLMQKLLTGEWRVSVDACEPNT